MFEDLHNLYFECLKIYTIYILNVWRFTQFIFLTRLICFFFELIVSLFFQCSKYSGSSKLLSPAYYCFQLATVCSNLLCQVKYYVHTSFFYTLVQLSLVQDFQYFSSIQIHKYYQTVLFIKIWTFFMNILMQWSLKLGGTNYLIPPPLIERPVY